MDRRIGTKFFDQDGYLDEPYGSILIFVSNGRVKRALAPDVIVAGREGEFSRAEAQIRGIRARQVVLTRRK